MIRTRFPPEPNGYLHLGHIKAMLYDFEYHPGCDCTLRLDDTNPDAEKQEYVNGILEDVAWMGFKPTRVTYTSDYFGALYDYAEELIRRGKAYVDFSTPEAIKEGRATGTESPWRSKDVDWNLTTFRAMRTGDYAEGECVLRLKINMADQNPNLRDPIAYRIRKTPHYRTGTAWCIYPSYDYSHGIVDALEQITHSYCTQEFYIRRPQYLWPVLELGLTPATVVEFGRLNVEGVTLSKRKILDLVARGEVEGFDDPRLFTVRGLRRRGFTPSVLKTLAGMSSMDRKDTELSRAIVTHVLRTELGVTAPKAMAVMKPLRVRILGDPDRAVFIETTDFREVDSPDYYRLAPGKSVRLRFDSVVSYVSHTADEVVVRPVEPAPKVKGIIHWLPVVTARPAWFHVYDDDAGLTRLLGWIREDVSTAIGAIYQFERLGFFRVDAHTADGVPIFILIVSLLNKFDAPVRA
jgi:glutaminyl-tRNA synthetase